MGVVDRIHEACWRTGQRFSCLPALTDGLFFREELAIKNQSKTSEKIGLNGG